MAARASPQRQYMSLFFGMLIGAFLVDGLLFVTPRQPVHRTLAARSAMSPTDLEEEARIRADLEEPEATSARHGAVAAGAARHAPPGMAATTEDQAKKSSFEDAQVLGRELAEVLTASCAAGEPMPEEAVKLLRALVSTTAGARGWFVSLLTNPKFDAVFQSPVDEVLLQAISDSPGPNIKLMTMNVAMSTATELAHLERGHPDLAAASRMTRDRSTVLLTELLGRLPGLRESVEALYSAVQVDNPEPSEQWVAFCKKWGYNAEQKEAIRKQLEPLLQ